MKGKNNIRYMIVRKKCEKKQTNKQKKRIGIPEKVI